MKMKMKMKMGIDESVEMSFLRERVGSERVCICVSVKALKIPRISDSILSD